MQKKFYGFRLHIVNGEINYVFKEYNEVNHDVQQDVYEIESNFENSRCFVPARFIWNKQSDCTYNRSFYFTDIELYDECEEDFIKGVVQEYQDVLKDIYDTLAVLNISKQKIIDKLTEVKSNVTDFTYVAISTKSKLHIIVDVMKDFTVEDNKLIHEIVIPSEDDPYGFSETYDLSEVNKFLPNGKGTWQNIVFDKKPVDILALVEQYYKMAFEDLKENHEVALSNMLKVTKMQKVTPQSV